MKKLLLLLFTGSISAGINAQGQEASVEAHESYGEMELATLSAQNVNDTLTPTVLQGCNTTATTYTISNGYAVGGNQSGITEAAQILNLDSSDVEVHSLLVFTTRKIAGPNPGDFHGMLYSSTDTMSPETLLGTTDAVNFANIDTVNPFTTFDFASPINVSSEPFFVAIEVENGSDTIAVATTGPNCGGGTALFQDANGWTRYATAYSAGGSAFDPVIYIFAEVEDNTVGLDPQFVSRSGIEFYPNPATDQAFIEVEMQGESDVEVIVRSMGGDIVSVSTHNIAGGQERIELDITSLAKGVYSCQVVGKKSQMNGVFVKE